MTPVRQTEVTQVDVGSGPVALRPGQTVVVGRKWFGLCNRCRALVRIDKPLIGSLHICLEPDE